jgi:hypothetical protein
MSKKNKRKFWIARLKELGTMPCISLQPFEIKEDEGGKYIRDYFYGPNSWVPVTEVIHCREVLDEPLISEEEIEKAAKNFVEKEHIKIKNEDDSFSLGYGFQEGIRWALEKMK